MISHFQILLLNRCTDLPYVCVDVSWLDPYKDCKKWCVILILMEHICIFDQLSKNCFP